jgi:NADPH-dependent 7-cyano-7-deazaguanine reductase QueF-like protein
LLKMTITSSNTEKITGYADQYSDNLILHVPRVSLRRNLLREEGELGYLPFCTVSGEE